MEQLKVTWEQLKPGDFIIRADEGNEYSDWDMGPRGPAGFLLDKVQEIGNGTHRLFSKDFTEGYFMGRNAFLYTVNRPVAPVVSPTLWNGTCLRCGKGTYTGAWKVEHEGPCVK